MKDTPLLVKGTLPRLRVPRGTGKVPMKGTLSACANWSSGRANHFAQCCCCCPWTGRSPHRNQDRC